MSKDGTEHVGKWVESQTSEPHRFFCELPAKVVPGYGAVVVHSLKVHSVC